MNIIVILDLWDIKIGLKYCHGYVSTFQGFTNECVYIYIYTHTGGKYIHVSCVHVGVHRRVSKKFHRDRSAHSQDSSRPHLHIAAHLHPLY